MHLYYLKNKKLPTRKLISQKKKSDMKYLYEKNGNVYTPSEHALGPWGPTALHGGATAGLMGHALELASDRDDLQFARMTLDMFRPVPLSPLTVESRIVRDGKRIQIIETTVIAAGKEVAKGTGLKLKQTEIELPDGVTLASDTLTDPEQLETMSMVGSTNQSNLPPGLHYNLQMKRISGFTAKGEGQAWFYMPLEVVKDKPTTPFVHMCMISDFGNGTGQIYVKNSMGSINADISLHLHRIPTEKWIGFDSKTEMQLNGVGIILTKLYDTKGPIGHISQCVMPQMMQKK